VVLVVSGGVGDRMEGRSSGYEVMIWIRGVFADIPTCRALGAVLF
jgi:hypothetical protein